MLFTQYEDCCEVDLILIGMISFCACFKGCSNYIVPLKHAFLDGMCGAEVQGKFSRCEMSLSISAKGPLPW